MLVGSGVSVHQFTVPNHLKNRHLHSYEPTSRRWQRSPVLTCCKRTEESTRFRTEKNYYELLGVSVNSTCQEIKEAYRKLQKIYHPDIAGPKGHERTMMLNKAYKVLVKEDLRREYDLSIGQLGAPLGRNIHGLGYSSWKGPLRPLALFVDENACIGCRECVHHASNTFTMDEAQGCARVKLQYGDDDPSIKVSVDSCPVNCIHWVDSDELPVLEFLVGPKPKEGYGIFGQGWERPNNVFAAARALNKQLNQEAESYKRKGAQDIEQETPAQAEARETASMKLKIDSFSKIWNWVNDIAGG
ncbi:hypothetical protein NMG60_11006684 [Bertholletia excelsa]